MSGKRGSRHGFAAMCRTDPARQRQLAVDGGRAAHRQGKAHRWTPAEAREAGRKGGSIRADRAARRSEPAA